MRKYIIYAILSCVLVAPIAAIIAVAIVSSSQSNYSYENNFETDLSGMVTDTVKCEKIEEILSISGSFDSNDRISIKKSVGYPHQKVVYGEIGDYFDAGEVIGNVNGEEIICDQDCQLIAVIESEDEIMVNLRPLKTTCIRVGVPIETYPYIKNSSVSFEWAGKQYKEIPYIENDSHAEADRTTVFNAYYKLPNGDYICDGTVDTTIKTGHIVENALTVPLEYIFEEKDGRYYVETISSSGVDEVYVTLGVFGENRVQIIPSSDMELSEGTSVVSNSVNVFLASPSSKEASDKTEDGEW